MKMDFSIKKLFEVFSRDGTFHRGLKMSIFLDKYVSFWKDVTLLLLILIFIELAAQHQNLVGELMAK